MKKTLITVFSIIGVLLIIILVWNFVFGGNMIGNILNGFADRINKLWGQVTGDANATLINVTEASASETIGW